jgi:hypothetical protein
MGHLLDIDTIIVLVRSDPLDPGDRLLEVNGCHETVIIALDVEHDAIGRYDACRGIAPLDISCARPARLANLIEPSIDRSLEGCVILVPDSRGHELA